MNKALHNKIGNIAYLSHFVAKAFLVSIIGLMLLLAIVFGIYFFDLIFNEESSEKPLFNGYIIVSQSMVPTINVNDGIVVKRMDNDKYQVGDIVSYVTNDSRFRGSVVTHRIVTKENDTVNSSIYTTKGDNNQMVDANSVYTSMINGKVLFRIPKIGYFYNFLSNPVNFIFCMLGAVIVLILGNVGRTMKILKLLKAFLKNGVCLIIVIGNNNTINIKT